MNVVEIHVLGLALLNTVQTMVKLIQQCLECLMHTNIYNWPLSQHTHTKILMPCYKKIILDHSEN